MNTKSFNRKTWLGVMFTFALVAVLGLTFAFIPAKPVSEKKVQPDLYWYSISSGKLASQLNSIPQNKEDSMPNGANPLTNCEDLTTVPCIVGYETVQSPGINVPATASPDHRITFN